MRPVQTCPSCSRPIAPDSNACPSCGAALAEITSAPTRAADRSASAASATSSGPSATSGGRFLPGMVLAERYRIVSRLGSGGMGEVYRADDVKLGQTVALKFLPPAFDDDPARLGRLLNEVRVARQVAHPNVCRVYDVAVADKLHFISMEYVDGEDLETLLHRIGRLPREKALQISREICAGLAAIHDQGIVHRDLKPANVMIDGRGRVRITDFGIAGLVAEVGGKERRSGTPGYMAPELDEGRDPSVRSDVYSLGLVLYELFTGKPAFDEGTRSAPARRRNHSKITPPSDIVENIDSAAERAILRCLKEAPEERPASALAVAAALPGGDPVAMALAAGETPSPEMVAASGAEGRLSPRATWLALLGVLVAAVAAFALSDEAGLLRRIPQPKSDAVLIDRAQTIIHDAGYVDPPAGTAFGYGWHKSYFDYLRGADASAARWERLAEPRPTSLFLWYRQSPRKLVPQNSMGMATEEDPPPLTPGMAAVLLSANGDLWRFEAVPPQMDETADPKAECDLAPLFAAAGLELAKARPAATSWVPSGFGDARFAWDAAYPDVPWQKVHVDAACYRGRPIYFNASWPWNPPLRARPFQESAGAQAANVIGLLLGAATLIGGAVLARRNLRMGRVDRRGAFRLAAFVFAVHYARSLLLAHHISSLADEWALLARLAADALFMGAVVWLIYIALEPLVRRRWPERIVAWTRLLAGQLSDPLVGRHILAGLVLGLGMAALQVAPLVVPAWLGRPSPMPDVRDLDSLRPLHAVAAVLGGATDATETALMLFFALFLIKLLVRRDGAAIVAFFVVGTSLFALQLWEYAGPFALLGGAAMALLLGRALLHYGMVSLAAAFFAYRLAAALPVAPPDRGMFAFPALLAALTLAGLAAWAARAALGGRSLFEVSASGD